jgi:hypothetical protein
VHRRLLKIATIREGNDVELWLRFERFELESTFELLN